MLLNNLLLPLVVLLSLNACSGDRDLEDPIRTIQNRQAMLDANAAKLPRVVYAPKISYPLPQTTKKVPESDFDIDQATGRVAFKAEVVYFEYDDAAITNAGMQHLEALAAYMREHPEMKLSIEGHCDHRGSVEYNLALGQRRSDSVRKYLSILKIPVERLDSVSFGKEKPVALGDSEEALAKNRRVEFAFKIYPNEAISSN